MSIGWHSAAFAGQEKLQPLQNYLEPEKVRAASDEAVRAMLNKLATTGGTDG